MLTAKVGEFGDAVISPDIDSEDDYPLPEDGSKEGCGAEYVADPRVLSDGAYPSLIVAVSKSNVEQTLVSNGMIRWFEHHTLF